MWSGGRSTREYSTENTQSMQFSSIWSCCPCNYYYCVISGELHKKDNWRVVEAEPGRWFVGAWQSTRDYAARGEPGDPRGRNRVGISGMDSPSRPARAEGEKRFRSATRNP